MQKQIRAEFSFLALPAGQRFSSFWLMIEWVLSGLIGFDVFWFDSIVFDWLIDCTDGCIHWELIGWQDWQEEWSFTGGEPCSKRPTGGIRETVMAPFLHLDIGVISAFLWTASLHLCALARVIGALGVKWNPRRNLRIYNTHQRPQRKPNKTWKMRNTESSRISFFSSPKP